MRFFLLISTLIWVHCAQGQERISMQYPYNCLHRSLTTLTGNIDFPLQCITADYVNTDFDSLADFSNAVFFSSANFTGARFNAAARFGLARFDSLTIFRETRFTQEANFTGVNFARTVLFASTEFRGFTIFLGTQFDSVAVFERVEFDEYTSFEEASFSNKADFNSVSFKGRAYFQGTILPDSLDLRRIQTNQPINLTLAQLDTMRAVDPTYRSLIALEGTDISKIKLNMELFKLWFPGLESQPEKKIEIYEDVLRKLEEDGFRDSYEILDIEYRSFTNTYKGRHFVHFFNKYLWNYGYNREWVAWWSLGIIGLITLFALFYVKRL